MLASLSFTALVAVALPAQQDAAAVLARVAAEQQRRWETVQNYTVVQRVAGMPTPMYLQRIVHGGQYAFQVVPPPEWDRARTGLSRDETVAIAEGMAVGLDLVGDAHVQEVGGPWGAHIKSMTNDMSFFLREVKQYDGDELEGDPAADAAMAAAFAKRARVAGRETIGTRQAIVIRAAGLRDVPMPQAGDGPEFRLEDVTLWIDEEAHVPLRLRMTGQVEGGAAPVVIELQELDHQQFGPLYEPTRRVMRISGMMEAMATDPKKRRDLAKARESAQKAQADMARMEQRLAEMPAAQRRMIEGQLDRARQQMKMLANGDELMMEIELEVIGINAGPPLDWRPEP